MKIGDRVITPDGVGTIKDIEFPYSENIKRYGVLHDVFPADKSRGLKDDILYYLKKDVKKAS